MRMRGRVDSNQTHIVDALRKMGATVAITSALGDGFPDIVVGYNGFNALVEIKDGSKYASQQQLTLDEAKFCSEWKGHYTIIKSVADCESLLNYLGSLKQFNFYQIKRLKEK